MNAVEVLAEVLDDALTPMLATESKEYVQDHIEDVAAVTISILEQFGWHLHNDEPVPDDDNDDEPKELNLLGGK